MGKRTIYLENEDVARLKEEGERVAAEIARERNEYEEKVHVLRNERSALEERVALVYAQQQIERALAKAHESDILAIETFKDHGQLMHSYQAKSRRAEEEGDMARL